MIRLFLHKVLTISLTFTLLLPIGISFLHAFETHHFQNCDDILQFHEHETETNCSVSHYMSGYQTLEKQKQFSLFIQKIINKENYLSALSFIQTSYSSKQLRAPPVY